MARPLLRAVLLSSGALEAFSFNFLPIYLFFLTISLELSTIFFPSKQKWFVLWKCLLLGSDQLLWSVEYACCIHGKWQERGLLWWVCCNDKFHRRIVLWAQWNLWEEELASGGHPLVSQGSYKPLEKILHLTRTQILLPWAGISLVLCSCCHHLWQCKGLRLTKPSLWLSLLPTTLFHTHSRSQQCKKLDVLFSLIQGQDYSSLEYMHLAPQRPEVLVMLLLHLPEQAFKI